MSASLRAVRAAFAYFSVLPVGGYGAAPGPGALAVLPLVGATLGGLAGAAGLLVSRVSPRPVAAAAALGAMLALTGALHLDGFLDGCDGFFASVPPARRREILKDPRHGTYALAGALGAGSLWFGALAATPPARLPARMAFAAALARAAAVANARALPHAPGTAAGAFAARPSARALAAVLGTLALAGPIAGPRARPLVPCALAASLLGGRAIAARLDGELVGDAYGFLVTALEIAVLAALCMPGDGS